MPKMRFTFDQTISEVWENSIIIPQEVVDQGEEAMATYVRENECDVEDEASINAGDTYIEESLQNPRNFEVEEEDDV